MTEHAHTTDIYTIGMRGHKIELVVPARFLDSSALTPYLHVRTQSTVMRHATCCVMDLVHMYPAFKTIMCVHSSQTNKRPRCPRHHNRVPLHLQNISSFCSPPVTAVTCGATACRLPVPTRLLLPPLRCCGFRPPARADPRPSLTFRWSACWRAAKLML